MMFALLAIALIAIVCIAVVAAIIIFPLFFFGLFIGAAFSAEFYKHLYERTKYRFNIHIAEDVKPLFIYNLVDFVEAFQWRAGDADALREECRAKEKAAMESLVRMERGVQNLNDTWKSLIDKRTIKENMLTSRKLVSLRIKKAALMTFEDPSFAKMSEELEEERIKFEDFLA